MIYCPKAIRPNRHLGRFIIKSRLIFRLLHFAIRMLVIGNLICLGVKKCRLITAVLLLLPENQSLWKNSFSRKAIFFVVNIITIIVVRKQIVIIIMTNKVSWVSFTPIDLLSYKDILRALYACSHE